LKREKKKYDGKPNGKKDSSASMRLLVRGFTATEVEPKKRLFGVGWRIATADQA
jgi:hypothetical protein